MPLHSGGTDEQDAESAVARLVRRLVLVRRGEGAALLWSAAYFFFLLSGYYMLRPVRETMGVQRGMDDLAWLFTGTLLVTFLANPVYSLLVSRTTRKRFIPITYHFFSINIVLFWALRQVVPESWAVYVGYVFYIWLSVFNMFAISVFWSFMADVFTNEQGKRLFAFIGAGGTLGATVGAAMATGLATAMASSERFGMIHLLLVSVVLIQCAVFCVRRIAAHAEARAGDDSSKNDETASAVRFHTAEPSADWRAGFVLFLRSPYLLGIAAYITLMTILATFVYFEQARWVSAVFETPEERTAAFAMIDLLTNGLTLLLQVFLTARLVKAIGVGPMLAVLPLITTLGFVALSIAPMFATLVAFQVSRRAAQYAIARPVREVLFTIVSPDEKYKSKAFIDTFIYRGGDLVGAWSHRAIAWAAVMVAPVAAVVGVAWLGVGLYLGVMHRVLAARHADDQAVSGASGVGAEESP